MANDRLPIFPKVYSQGGNQRVETLQSQSGFADDTSSTYDYPTGGTFVFTNAGLLRPLATDGISVLGYVGDDWKGDETVKNPPYARFGNRHEVVNPRRTRFAVSVTNASGALGQANSAPRLADITLGSTYGCYRFSSGTHLDKQCLDQADTTNTIFKVVDKPTHIFGEDQDDNTYNPIVIVEIIDSKIQSPA